MPQLMMMAAALVSAQTAIPQNFETVTQAGQGAPICTADGQLCVTGTREGSFTITRGGKAAAQWSAEKEEDGDHFTALPAVLRLSDGSGALVSVGVWRNRSYSGGFADVGFQRIMLVRWGQPPVKVMEAPYASAISVRACFDEEDTEQRLDACADQYTLTSTLRTAADTHGGLPDLILEVRASNYPRGVTRNSDSLAMPALTEADLIEETDATCTYDRRYTFDAKAQSYRPDTPLPACEDFTVP